MSHKNGLTGINTSEQISVTAAVRSKIMERFNVSRLAGNASQNSNINPNGSSAGTSLDLLDSKKKVAVKIASSLPTSGSSAKIIMAFIQVADYEGLDKYLSKNEVKKDILNLAMQKACIMSNAEAVRILAERGADVRFQDQFGTTMLHFAIKGGGDSTVISTLISHNACYEDYNKDGLFLIHWACQRDHLDLVKLLVSKDPRLLDQSDESGRLPIHVSAVYGRPIVLKYLIDALANQLNPLHVAPAYRTALIDSSQCPDNKISTDELNKMRIIAAANYLDMQGATPLHHANSEEATNDYSASIRLLLDNGADLMLQTPHGKTALDLAYGAGRSKVLIDILPTEQMLTLLQRIDDVVPREVRNQFQESNMNSNNRFADFESNNNFDRKGSSMFLNPHSSQFLQPESPFGSIKQNRNRFGYSIIKKTANNTAGSAKTSPKRLLHTATHQEVCPWDKPSKSKEEEASAECIQILNIWRKILLNDDVELLEYIRDSMFWRNNSAETTVGLDKVGSTANRRKSSTRNPKNVDDFESSQGITMTQMVELFNDCYENGIGVYSHVQSTYGIVIKQRGMRTLIRSLTGLQSFKHLTTNNGIIIFRPMYLTIIFLAVLCGRFRIAEALLRMRQFDIIPACILTALIVRRFHDDPNFPEQTLRITSFLNLPDQRREKIVIFIKHTTLFNTHEMERVLLKVRSELESFANMAEGIAVDVLSQVYLKDNTLKKAVCRDFLNVPLRSFGEVSIVDLCATAKCTALLSLPCCQRVLDQRWDGVLSYLPHGFRFISRFCPLVGLLHLEERARKERTKALLDCIAASANKCQNNSRGSIQDASAFILRERRSVVTGVPGEIPPMSVPQVQIKSQPSIKSTNLYTKPASSTPAIRFKKPVTVYDELRDQYGWSGSPRLNFVLTVYHSPSAKFLYHSLLHLTFLCIFSYVLVCDLGLDYNQLEQISLLYVLGYFMEECRQIAIEYLRDGASEYWKDMWNWIDILAIFCTIAGGIFRLIPEHQKEIALNEETRLNKSIDETFYERLLYICGLTLFYMRTLYFTSIWPIIGPRLKMMADMLKKDLLPLLVVFLIFISSFGVAFQGLLNPNNYEFDGENKNNVSNITAEKVISSLFHNAFYSMFEVSIMFEGENVKKSYPDGFKAVEFGFLVIYSGIVNVILINLLIALFSNTVSRIDQRSTSHWLADRYQMVMEYNDRSVLPPPFNMLSICYEIFILTYRRYHKCDCISNDDHSSVEIQGVYVDLIAEDLSTSDGSEKEDSDEFVNKDSLIGFNFGPNPSEKRGTYFSRLKEKDKDKKKKKMKKRKSQKSEKFHTINDKRLFDSAKYREADICLRFILVQSFSLKDKRHTLGYMTSSSALLPSHTGGLTVAGGEKSMISAASNQGTAINLSSTSGITNQLGNQLKSLEGRMNGLEIKIDQLLVKLENQESFTPPPKRFQGRLPRQLSPGRKQAFEKQGFSLPIRSSSTDRAKITNFFDRKNVASEESLLDASVVRRPGRP